MIPYGRQLVEDDDIDAVRSVLAGEWLTGGPWIAAFERALCAQTGAAHAVAFANGTAALHAALAVSGIGPGDHVLTSPLSFVASANCARYVGASVDFVDIDPKTLNLDPGGVGECDALVAVHFAGLPVDLTALPVRPRVLVEDAAHALGASTPDGPVGNCAHSDMCTFSFHPVKAITTGEGGAVTTNSSVLADGLRAFRNHGMVRRPELGGWHYDVATVGYNYRITDMQAALGVTQLSKLARFVARRNELASRYHELLAALPIDLPPVAPLGWRHAYHVFAVRVPGRRAVYDAMHAAGIAVQVHYVPIYKHSLFADVGRDGADFPETERAYSGLLSLPLYPGLSERDQDRVVEVLSQCIG